MSDVPSVSVLAGQLSYLFEDSPDLSAASDAELTARLNHDDRFARARERYPLASDDEIHQKVAEFNERITESAVRDARRQIRP